MIRYLYASSASASTAGRPLSRAGLVDVVNELGDRRVDRAQTVQQERRVEGDRDVVALQHRVDPFHSLCVVAGAGLQDEDALLEAEPYGGVALGDQGHGGA
ncbi:hypothetical protein SCALM49S_01297 [Streptomyces californicus]